MALLELTSSAGTVESSEHAEFRPEELLRCLQRHDVDFVVIGGLAGMVLGSAYPSYDLDIAYERAPMNLDRLAAALRDLGATLRGAPADLPLQLDAKTLANGANFTFDTPYGALDIFAEPAGAPRYAELQAAGQTAEIEGVPVRVSSLEHLIAMKEAAGRPKDKLMATEYRGLADRRYVVELLDGIPGAFERAQLGRRQADAGETVPLDDL
jgi:hypothetical protein